MNGVMIGPDTQKNIDALKKADWLVVGEIYPDETSEFWRAPGITLDEMKKINTTVYRLPCAGFAEKDGSMTNSARWLQWKNAALPPPGDARLDQDIVAQIFLRVRDLYKKEGGKFPDPILNLTWPYTDPQHPALDGHRPGDQREGAGRSYRSRDPADCQRQANNCPASPGSRTMAPRHVATGFTPDPGRKPDRNLRGAERKIPRGSASIQTGRGPGRRIAVFSITVRRAILKESLGIPIAGRCGGTKPRSAGWATTFRTSNPTRIRKTTWAPSS